MRATIAVAVVALAHSVIAGLPGLAKRATTCNEGHVPCGDTCIQPEVGEHCCPDNSNFCSSNQVCAPRPDGDGMKCVLGEAPDLGQYGEADCLEPMLPCGTLCFQPQLTSSCCGDSTVCYNKKVCVAQSTPGKFKCCDPETEDCKGVVPPLSASSSASPASSTPASSTTAAISHRSTAVTTVNLTSTSTAGCNSTMTHPILPTGVPTSPESCHGWTDNDFEVLNDAVVLLVDILSKKGYNYPSHSCGGAEESKHGHY